MIQIFIVFNLLTLFHSRIDQLFMIFTGYVFSWEHFLQHSSVQYFEENMTLIFVNESWCLNGSRVILPFYIYKVLFKVSQIFWDSSSLKYLITLHFDKLLSSWVKKCKINIFSFILYNQIFLCKDLGIKGFRTLLAPYLKGLAPFLDIKWKTIWFVTDSYLYLLIFIW